MADAKQRYGYPEKFRTCWGKNTDEKIFQVANYLFENDLDNPFQYAASIYTRKNKTIPEKYFSSPIGI